LSGVIDIIVEGEVRYPNIMICSLSSYLQEFQKVHQWTYTVDAKQIQLMTRFGVRFHVENENQSSLVIPIYQVSFVYSSCRTNF